MDKASSTSPPSAHEASHVAEWIERHLGEDFTLSDWQKDVLRQMCNRPVKVHPRVWEFDVYYTTHERLQRGETQAARSRVEVISTSYLDAQRVAAWMVLGRGYYVTSAEYLGCQPLH